MGLISRVLGAYRVTDKDQGGEYVVAWGINNTSFVQARLEPRDGDPCSFDFQVESGPLPVLTPAAAIAPLSKALCEVVYVYGDNGKVSATSTK